MPLNISRASSGSNASGHERRSGEKDRKLPAANNLRQKRENRTRRPVESFCIEEIQKETHGPLAEHTPGKFCYTMVDWLAYARRGHSPGNTYLGWRVGLEKATLVRLLRRDYRDGPRPRFGQHSKHESDAKIARHAASYESSSPLHWVSHLGRKTTRGEQRLKPLAPDDTAPSIKQTKDQRPADCQMRDLLPFGNKSCRSGSHRLRPAVARVSRTKKLTDPRAERPGFACVDFFGGLPQTIVSTRKK